MNMVLALCVSLHEIAYSCANIQVDVRWLFGGQPAAVCWLPACLPSSVRALLDRAAACVPPWQVIFKIITIRSALTGFSSSGLMTVVGEQGGQRTAWAAALQGGKQGENLCQGCMRAHITPRPTCHLLPGCSSLHGGPGHHVNRGR